MMRQKSTENLLDAYTRSNSIYAESGNWFLIRLWVVYAIPDISLSLLAVYLVLLRIVRRGVAQLRGYVFRLMSRPAPCLLSSYPFAVRRTAPLRVEYLRREKEGDFGGDLAPRDGSGTMKAYPIKLTAHVRTYAFGERLIPEKLGKKGVPEGVVAETWEVSDYRETSGQVINGEYAGLC